MGLLSKEIAQELNLATRTVDNYLTAVRDQLGCRSSREIIARYNGYYKHLVK